MFLILDWLISQALSPSKAVGFTGGSLAFAFTRFTSCSGGQHSSVPTAENSCKPL